MLPTLLGVLGAAAGLASAATFQVTVGIRQTDGQVGEGFDPNRILPAAGDTVIFSFGVPSYISNPQTGSYDVTQSSADSPCQPLSGGFSTGAQTTVPGDGAGPQFTLAINDTTPLYFYSGVGNQCQDGMVLGINTPAQGDGSIDSYAAAAAALGGGSSSVSTDGSSSTAASGSATSTGSSSARPSSSASSTRSASASNLPSSVSASAPSASASRVSSGVATEVSKAVAFLALLATLARLVAL